MPSVPLHGIRLRGVHSLRANVEEQLRAGTSRAQQSVPRRVVHHQYWSVGRRPSEVGARDVGGARRVYVPRSMLGLYGRWIQVHPRRDVAEGDKERVPPDAPPQRRSAGKDRRCERYDIIIVDCLPSLGILAINALIASDKFIVPMQCEHYSLEGLAQLLSTVKKVKRTSNKNLSLMGIVFTMLDKRLLQSNEIMRDIKRNFPPSSIFNTVIPRNVRISEAPSHGMPVIYYDKSSKGAESYMKLAGEIIKKLND